MERGREGREKETSVVLVDEVVDDVGEENYDPKEGELERETSCCTPVYRPVTLPSALVTVPSGTVTLPPTELVTSSPALVTSTPTELAALLPPLVTLAPTELFTLPSALVTLPYDWSCYACAGHVTLQ